MVFAGVNHWAVVIAAIVGFIFGGIWYNVLSRHWMAAVNRTEQDIKGSSGRPSPVPFILAFIAQLVMAWTLAGLLGHLGGGQVTLRNGIISALFIWFGFVFSTLVVNHAFQGAKRELTLIDGGHWLGVLLLQGAVIGWIGVR